MTGRKARLSDSGATGHATITIVERHSMPELTLRTFIAIDLDEEVRDG